MTNFANSWLTEYGDILFRFAFSRVNDRERAEDLVQETFVSAIKGYDNFEKRSSEKSWLFSILKHKIIDFYRSKGRNSTDSFESDEMIDSLFNESGHWKESVQEWNSPELALQNSEFRKVLQNCIEHLPQMQRDVFQYRDLDGLSGEDICKLLSLSSSNLWVVTHRARHRLRDCLTANWFGGER